MIQLAIKDLKLFFKDRRAMILSFLIPILLITLFAFAFGGVGNDGNHKITLLVSDLDQSAASKEAVKRLDTLKSIDLQQTDMEQAQRSIKKGDECCVLVIHKGFSDSLKKGSDLPIELQYDEARDIEVGLIQQSLIPTLATLPFSIGNPREMMGARLSGIVGVSDEQAKEEIREQSDNLFDAIAQGISESGNQRTTNPMSRMMGGDIQMTPLIASTNNNELGLIQAVAGTSVMMLLFAVVGIGMSLLDEKQEGTLRRMLYSPMNPSTILLGKMISANVISIFQLIVMFLFSSLVFGLKLLPHLPGFAVTVVATAFACSAFGVLLASFAQTRQQVQGLSTLIILVMSAVGGSMVPLFLMPKLMQQMGVLSVNYWSIQSFFDVFWRHLSLWDPTFWMHIAMLLLIGVVLNSIAIWMFKRNILKMN